MDRMYTKSMKINYYNSKTLLLVFLSEPLVLS